jgi:hypothetical protein
MVIHGTRIRHTFQRLHVPGCDQTHRPKRRAGAVGRQGLAKGGGHVLGRTEERQRVVAGRRKAIQESDAVVTRVTYQCQRTRDQPIRQTKVLGIAKHRPVVVCHDSNNKSRSGLAVGLVTSFVMILIFIAPNSGLTVQFMRLEIVQRCYLMKGRNHVVSS